MPCTGREPNTLIVIVDGTICRAYLSSLICATLAKKKFILYLVRPLFHRQTPSPCLRPAFHSPEYLLPPTVTRSKERYAHTTCRNANSPGGVSVCRQKYTHSSNKKDLPQSIKVISCSSRIRVLGAQGELIMAALHKQLYCFLPIREANIFQSFV